MMKLWNSMQMDAKLPDTVKFFMVFIDRVGFPILVSIYLAYLTQVTISRNTAALTKLAVVIEEKLK